MTKLTIVEQFVIWFNDQIKNTSQTQISISINDVPAHFLCRKIQTEESKMSELIYLEPDNNMLLSFCQQTGWFCLTTNIDQSINKQKLSFYQLKQDDSISSKQQALQWLINELKRHNLASDNIEIKITDVPQQYLETHLYKYCDSGYNRYYEIKEELANYIYDRIGIDCSLTLGTALPIANQTIPIEIPDNLKFRKWIK